MTFTIMNLVSLFVLAIGGAFLIMSGRRMMRVVRDVERRLSRAVDEKNILAAQLRQARRESENIRTALNEAEMAIAQMAGASGAAEARLERLRSAPKRSILLLDRHWQRMDRMWNLMLVNNSIARHEAAPGLTNWDQGRVFHGFARSAEELRARAMAKYPPMEGFIAGTCAVADITEDGAGDAQPAGH